MTHRYCTAANDCRAGFAPRDQDVAAAMCAAHDQIQKYILRRFGQSGFSASFRAAQTREAGRGPCLEMGRARGVRRVRLRRRDLAGSVLGSSDQQRQSDNVPASLRSKI